MNHPPTIWTAVHAWIIGVLLLVAFPVHAVESLCAKVEMQIIQEATLERQAFDAQIRILNGLENLTMEDVSIQIVINDEDGNVINFTSNPADTNALFFVTVSSMLNITNLTGSGTVNASTTVQVNWLIIPTPGAAGTAPFGKRYFIGANLTYSLNGRDQTLEVTPDSIFVRPQPLLTLDYFLPDDVFADDAFTPDVEPSIPFSLGVRVQNNGYGVARSLVIDSGQPSIIENELGLLISFNIIGSEVHGRASPHTLRVNFGDVAGQDAAIARWTMLTSLSGRFTNFNATFSHADELGGELTSLLEEVNTHTLVHDVLVDSPGRDRVRDFLAREGANLRVYESENTDTSVSDQSGGSSLDLVSVNGSRQVFRLTVPPTAGPLYVSKSYLNVDNAVIVSATRFDGKQIKTANRWLFKTRSSPTNDFVHSVRLFDVNGGGVYTLVIDDSNALPIPPVMQPLADQVTRVGDPPIQFNVVASDANGTIPALGLLPAPPGSTFSVGVSNGLAVGAFSWAPTNNQEGVYPVWFTASDATLSTSQLIRLYVGEFGESYTTGGIPLSLTNWSPRILDVVAESGSGISTVKWESVVNVPYDIYYSDQTFGTGMTWNLLQSLVVAPTNETEFVDAGLTTNRASRFYQVKLNGDAPSMNDVWGVLRRQVLGSRATMVSAPLQMDRRFDGRLGQVLAAVLNGDNGGAGDGVGDEVHIRTAGGAWQRLYLDAAGVWREENGDPSTLALSAGQGFFITRFAVPPTTVTFTGAVGDQGTRTNRIHAGWNLIGLSEGRTFNLQTLLGLGNNGGPLGGRSEEAADLIALMRPDGTWRRFMRVNGWGAPFDGNWVDLETGEVVELEMKPGDAYYYFRQAAPGTMDVTF